jgi:hypothetical protein
MEPDVRILIIDNQASVVKDLRALIVCVCSLPYGDGFSALLAARIHVRTSTHITPYKEIIGSI